MVIYGRRQDEAMLLLSGVRKERKEQDRALKVQSRDEGSKGL